MKRTTRVMLLVEIVDEQETAPADVQHYNETHALDEPRERAGLATHADICTAVTALAATGRAG
jgi:hypothetical protein